MDMNLMVRGFVWNSLAVDKEEGGQVEEEALGVVGAMDEALHHAVLSTESWYLDSLPLAVGRISRTICEMLVMFSSLMSLKMGLVLWSILAMKT